MDRIEGSDGSESYIIQGAGQGEGIIFRERRLNSFYILQIPTATVSLPYRTVCPKNNQLLHIRVARPQYNSELAKCMVLPFISQFSQVLDTLR